GGVALQTVAMECRLREPTLAAMELALAGEESVAQQNAGPFEHPALGEVGLVGDQDVLDPVGMIEQVRILGTQAELNDVTMQASRVLEEPRRVFSKVPEHAQDQPAFDFRRMERGLHYFFCVSPCRR